MIAAIVAVSCAVLTVVAFRREGGPISFVGTDFRTLVAHERYSVDWVTGTVANLQSTGTVVDTTETTQRWNEHANAGQGAYVDFKTRSVTATELDSFRILYDDRSLDVKLTVMTGGVIAAGHFKGTEGMRLTVIWLTKQGEQRGHYWRFLNHHLRSYGRHPVADRTEQDLLSEPNWGPLAALLGAWAAAQALGGGFLYGIGAGGVAAALYVLLVRPKHERRRQAYSSEMERFGRFIDAQEPREKDHPPADASTWPGEVSL